MIARVFDDDNSMYYCTLCSRPMKELNQANEHEKYCGKAVPVQPTFEKDDATQFYTNEARTWQGLTNEDWEQIHDKKDTALDTFQQGAVWAQARLKGHNR